MVDLLARAEDLASSGPPRRDRRDSRAEAIAEEEAEAEVTRTDEDTDTRREGWRTQLSLARLNLLSWPFFVCCAGAGQEKKVAR